VNLVENFVEEVKHLESVIQPVYEFIRRFKINEYKSVEGEFKVS
jgi:hypothetical protein